MWEHPEMLNRCDAIRYGFPLSKRTGLLHPLPGSLMELVDMLHSSRSVPWACGFESHGSYGRYGVGLRAAIP